MISVRLRRLPAEATALAVCTVVATACGSSGTSAGSAAKPGALATATLNGSGSTFQLPFLEEAARAFKSDHSDRAADMRSLAL